MKHLLTCALAFAATAILSACGGGGSGTGTTGDGNGAESGMPETRPSPTPQKDTRDIAEMLADGATLTARHVAGWTTNSTRDTAALSDWDQFTVRLNDSGQYVIVMEGVEYTFTEADRNQHGYESPGDIGMYCWTCGDDGELRGRDDYFAVLDTGRGVLSYEEERISGFAVVGNATDLNATTQAGTASYTGGDAVVRGTSADFNDSDNPRRRFDFRRGRPQLTANFDTSMISGTIDGFRDYEQEGDPFVDWFLTIPQTPFGNDGFSGEFAVHDLDPGESASLTYEGSFFGPEADRVAGAISGTVTSSDGSPYVAYGHFHADKSEAE